ncbi:MULTISPECIES: sigma-70 family RNA polymerase sigma factor [Streptacidiphilus]|uniref:RNA polymerase sigma factor n=1 Tax=Streptacidiphilus cavernicola TaxID=3342716 RepID=A0ABV6UKQ4_9ACTN|nr:sigma-70 family RNA polymerase sigma factor [Streptacidiphilus jeojiense]
MAVRPWDADDPSDAAEKGAALPGDATFVRETEPFRRELLAHCYRLLGSVQDAEDLVQETYVRAWRGYAAFEHRSSVRTWLYRIATNACLTALEHHSRRVLPSGLGAAEPDPDTVPQPGEPGTAWLQPLPDGLVAPGPDDPESIVIERESLRLALVASWQYLPGRQRAVLILRDVLAFPAAEVAEMLGTTTEAVKSTLQRARARLRQSDVAAESVAEVAEPAARALLDQYIAAFENADTLLLEKLLCQEATLEATPLRTWFAGRSTCVPFLGRQILGVPGDWRMLPTSANGQPAAVGYRRDGDGVHRAYGVAVLTVRADGIIGVVSFGDPGLVPAFGFPTDLGESTRTT